MPAAPGPSSRAQSKAPPAASPSMPSHNKSAMGKGPSQPSLSPPTTSSSVASASAISTAATSTPRKGREEQKEAMTASTSSSPNPLTVSSSSSVSSAPDGSPSSSSSWLTKAPLLTERAVIHDGMIRSALHRELAHQFDPASIPSPQQIDPLTATTLILSFSNLASIDHLSSFSSLTTLQLDNNHIESISGLDSLVNLTWLDLSFNSIRRIEGLTALTRLTDLALSHNQIEHITNLHHLHPTLQTLTLACNRISSLDEIRALRPFTALRLLVLKGNPIEKNNADEYGVNVFAFLPQLTYFDYVMVETGQRLKARDAKLDVVLMLEGKEAEREKEEADKVEAEKRKDRNRQNGCEGMERLWRSIEDSDADMRKLKAGVPGVGERVTVYEMKVDGIVKGYEESMGVIGGKKREEEEKVREVLTIVGKRAEEESQRAIKQFQREKKELRGQYDDLTVSSSSSSSSSPSVPPSTLSALTSLLNRYHSTLHSFISSLMSIEHQLTVQHDQLSDAFAAAITTESQQSAQLTQATFAALLASAKEYHDDLHDHVQTLLDANGKDDAAKKEGGHQQQVGVAGGGGGGEGGLLSDKEALLALLSGSRDLHDVMIMGKEDEVREREEKELAAVVDRLRKEGMERNRIRVQEIYDIKRREERIVQEMMDRLTGEDEGGEEDRSDAR